MSNTENIEYVKRNINKNIENVLDEFYANIKSKTTNLSDFITLDEIETYAEKMIDDVKSECIKFTSEIISAINESQLIEQKKKNMRS